MGRERGSTGYSTDVLDAGKMAAAPQKVPTTASAMKNPKVRQKVCNPKDVSSRLSEVAPDALRGLIQFGRMPYLGCVRVVFSFDYAS